MGCLWQLDRSLSGSVDTPAPPELCVSHLGSSRRGAPPPGVATVMAKVRCPLHLGQSLRSLEVFSEEYGALPDRIKADNLMMRKDGTLVFSDPVFME